MPAAFFEFNVLAVGERKKKEIKGKIKRKREKER